MGGEEEVVVRQWGNTQIQFLYSLIPKDLPESTI